LTTPSATPSPQTSASRLPSSRPARPLLWGVLLLCTGFGAYLLGIVLSIFRLLLFAHAPQVTRWNQNVIWYSGIPTTLGVVLSAIDLFVLLPRKRHVPRWINGDEGPVLDGQRMTVVLTAYNDEESIAAAVADFRAHRLVHRVIVVSNNSKDATMPRALDAGAIVYNELNPGYGHCVYRCLAEGLRCEDAGIIVLCEGDCTFRAFDLDKFLAYLPHAELVNGTRIVEQLRAYNTQLSTFMYYGNFCVGKLLELKHLGRGTFTDVGTTYKVIRRASLERLMPHLKPASVNLEFNTHLLDTALQLGIITVECPVTFHPRVGKSKGGNVNNLRALSVGLRMIWGIAFGWKGKTLG
jgi:hypothetical protein